MSISPSESLQALKAEVAALTDQHPKNPMASVPRAETQIPWICRTLDEAASALQTKKIPLEIPSQLGKWSVGLSSWWHTYVIPAMLHQWKWIIQASINPYKNVWTNWSG